MTVQCSVQVQDRFEDTSCPPAGVSHHHSDHKCVLSARQSVCLNGRHHREPVHLFNQSLTGGEHSPMCLSDLSRGRRPQGLRLDSGWDDLWPSRCFISVRGRHPWSLSVSFTPPFSLHLCPVLQIDFALTRLNVAWNTAWLRLISLQLCWSEEIFSVTAKQCFENVLVLDKLLLFSSVS